MIMTVSCVCCVELHRVCDNDCVVCVVLDCIVHVIITVLCVLCWIA